MIRRDPEHVLRMTMLEAHHGTAVAFADGADDTMGVAIMTQNEIVRSEAFNGEEPHPNPPRQRGGSQSPPLLSPPVDGGI